MSSNVGEEYTLPVVEFKPEVGASHFSSSGDRGISSSLSNTGTSAAAKRPRATVEPVGPVKHARSGSAIDTADFARVSSPAPSGSPPVLSSNPGNKKHNKNLKGSSRTISDRATCALLPDSCSGTPGTIIRVDFASAGEKAAYCIPSSQFSENEPVCRVNKTIGSSCALRPLRICTWNVNGLKKKKRRKLKKIDNFLNHCDLVLLTETHTNASCEEVSYAKSFFETRNTASFWSSFNYKRAGVAILARNNFFKKYKEVQFRVVTPGQTARLELKALDSTVTHVYVTYFSTGNHAPRAKTEVTKLHACLDPNCLSIIGGDFNDSAPPK